MTNSLEVIKNVVVICHLMVNTNNNNLTKPLVNVENIVSCTNVLNEELIVVKPTHVSPQNNSDNNVYIINDSSVKINN